MVVHPDHLFAAVSKAEFAAYSTQRADRHRRANQRWVTAMLELSGAGSRPANAPPTASFVQFKNAAPYADDQLSAVLLDPTARATQNPETGEWKIQLTATAPSPVLHSASITVRPAQKPHASALETKAVSVPVKADGSNAALTASAQVLASNASVGAGTVLGVGVDMEEIKGFESKDDVFLQRNFTAEELAYCKYVILWLNNFVLSSFDCVLITVLCLLIVGLHRTVPLRLLAAGALRKLCSKPSVPLPQMQESLALCGRMVRVLLWSTSRFPLAVAERPLCCWQVLLAVWRTRSAFCLLPCPSRTRARMRSPRRSPPSLASSLRLMC